MSEQDPAPEVTEPATVAGVVVPRWVVRGALGVIAVLVALAVTMGVLAAGDGDESAERSEVAAVAGRLTEALFTFDYRALEADRERVLELATGNLEQEYTRAFSGPIREQLVEARATGTASVKDLFVGDVDAERASVIAVVDVVVSSIDGERSTFDNFVLLSLVRLSSGWRVDGVTTLNPAVGRGLAPVPGEGTGTTTSTVPTG